MPHQIIDSAAGVAGRVLSGAAGALAAVRPAAKPLHPEGAIFRGRLVRNGANDPTGAEWLDTPGENDALVRVSRAVGLPGPLPDIHGLAVRVVLGDEDYGDLLLATTGWNRVTRHLLAPGRSPARPMTTLLPYRTPSGPVVLGARPADPGARGFDLAWAPTGGAWQPLGRLDLQGSPEPDAVVSFDPVLHQLPGLDQYGWVVRLRERSYATARSSRS
ncbi:MAG TPA: hypothetical protein VD859_17425 [Nocardioides sp.]|nr:hypothetical protein [Nocardioides sp.]